MLLLNSAIIAINRFCYVLLQVKDEVKHKVQYEDDQHDAEKGNYLPIQFSKFLLAALNEHHKEHEENHVPNELKHAEEGLDPLERCVGRCNKLGFVSFSTVLCSYDNHDDIK